MANPAVRGELGLERFDVLAQYEVAPLHHLVHGVLDLSRDRRVLRSEVDKRNVDGAQGATATLARSACARARMRTTARPSRPSDRGRPPVRTQSTKCASSSCSGS